jgi:hypothetical protein
MELATLWAASVEAGGETVALLRAGYPTEALVRWRPAREAEVRALLIARCSSDVAESYLKHTSLRTTQM